MLPLIITANGRSAMLTACLASHMYSRVPLDIRLVIQGGVWDGDLYALRQIYRALESRGHRVAELIADDRMSVAQMRWFALSSINADVPFVAMTDCDVLMGDVTQFARALDMLVRNDRLGVVHLPAVDVDNARGFDDYKPGFQNAPCDGVGQAFTAYHSTVNLDYSPTQGVWRHAPMREVAQQDWPTWPKGRRGYDVHTSKAMIGKGMYVVALGQVSQPHLYTKKDNVEGLWTSAAFNDHPVV